MSRYTGPKTRINRRFGMAIFAPTKAFERKPHPPGQHGPRLRRRSTPGSFSVGLNEKQKLRFMFGLSETQFYNLFLKAKEQKGVTGETFLRLLTLRLDHVVYAMGFAKSISAARQFVNHGHVKVNGHKLDIPSYTCKIGDELEIKEKTSARQLATRALEETQGRPSPAWLTVNADSLKGTVNREPQREEMEQSINEQLIVEFYSR